MKYGLKYLFSKGFLGANVLGTNKGVVIKNSNLLIACQFQLLENDMKIPLFDLQTLGSLSLGKPRRDSSQVTTSSPYLLTPPTPQCAKKISDDREKNGSVRQERKWLREKLPKYRKLQTLMSRIENSLSTSEI